MSDPHTIRRLSPGMSTVINHLEISRHHAAIEWTQNTQRIKDLNLNGTWLNKKRLKKNTFYQLYASFIIQFGNFNNNVFTLADTSPPQDILLLDVQIKNNDQ